MGKYEAACREIVETLLRLNNPTPEDLNKIKMQVLKKFHLDKIPSNSELLRYLRSKEEKRKLRFLLMKKRVRSISGVVTTTVMVKPFKCPKPVPCIYCPGGPALGTPQSYTRLEPACRRALRNAFDPYDQVIDRIRQLKTIGHTVDKVELIILGGTFTALPTKYQYWFVKRCLDALNGIEARNFNEAKRIASSPYARIRNSGITIETRPDCAKEKEADILLDLGVTRVEIGVQSLYDDVYKIIKRGHTVDDVIESFRILKDSGFKIVAHLMLNLPAVSYTHLTLPTTERV